MVPRVDALGARRLRVGVVIDLAHVDVGDDVDQLAHVGDELAGVVPLEGLPRAGCASTPWTWFPGGRTLLGCL